ncbi:MAG: 5-(carboxyamino)imidazole ribonucleotide mutase [Deltaproteobacteria bacterium]|nr:5-(carboxyamino)imidazole ribonucleotide mutase [Deltaproteobacteria bacterium]
MNNPQVLIILGSSSDLQVMEGAEKTLKEFGVSCEVRIASAHRTPHKAMKLASSAADNGTKVVIAAAGYAAHLAGSIAAHTTLPVIGVPLDASALNGFDSLLSTVQMPAGVPVATVTIGKSGAKNAAILAVQILAHSDDALTEKLKKYKEDMAKKVDDADSKLAR